MQFVSSARTYSRSNQIWLLLTLLLSWTELKAAQEQDEQKLTIQALGRTARLGFLYDERTAQFDDVYVFNSPILKEEFIEVTEAPHSSVKYEIVDSIGDKLNLLEVHASLSAEILSGMLKVSGSAGYLMDEQKSLREVKGVMILKTQTVVENLQIYYETLKGLYNTEVLHQKRATHIVTGIKWGAGVSIEFSDMADSDRTKEEINGKLQIEFEKVKQFKISAEASVQINGSDTQQNSTFTISVKGDITLPDKIPSTYQQVKDYISKVPELIRQTNEGKGVPLEYTLTPIDPLRKFLSITTAQNDFAKKLDESILNDFIAIFDDMSFVQRQLYDLSELLKGSPVCLSPKTRRALTELRANFAYAKTKFTSKLKTTMIGVRSNTLDESALSELAQSYNEDPFSADNADIKLKQFDDAERKIKFYRTVRKSYPNIQYFGLGSNLDASLLRDVKDVVYALYTKPEFTRNDETAWEENRKLFFDTLNQPFNKLYFVDCDFDFPSCSSFNRTTLQQIVKGAVTITDVNKDMKKSLEPTDERRMKALGRFAAIGQLYDARTDRFIKDNILVPNYPYSTIHVSSKSITETRRVQSEAYIHKFRALGVDKEAQFDILANLYQSLNSPNHPGRSGLYLKPKPEALFKDTSAYAQSIVYTRRLDEQELNVQDDQFIQHFAVGALSKGATHFVRKIEYGFNSIFSVVNENTKKSFDFQSYLNNFTYALKGYLSRIKISKTHTNSAKDSMYIPDFDTELDPRFSLKVYSDIQAHGLDPITIDNNAQLVEFFKSTFIPQQRSQNDGKGWPIAYVLYPLANLATDIGALSPFISYGSILADPSELESIRDDLARAHSQIQQMKARLQSNMDYVSDSDFQIMEKITKTFSSDLLSRWTQICQTISKIKSGVLTGDALTTLLEQYRNRTIFDNNNVYIELKNLRYVEDKIQLFTFAKNKTMEYIGRESTTGSFNDIFTKHSSDFPTLYVMYYQHKWTQENGDRWRTVSTFFFGDLLKGSRQFSSSKLILVNCEFEHANCDQINSPVIWEYTQGLITSKDVVNTREKEDSSLQKKFLELKAAVASVDTKVTRNINDISTLRTGFRTVNSNVIENQNHISTLKTKQTSTESTLHSLGMRLNNVTLSGEQKWKKLFSDYELNPRSVYAPDVQMDAKLNDLHWIRDLIANQSSADLKTETAKLSNWLLRLENAENIFEGNGSLKSLESQETALSELMDDSQLYSFASVLYDKAKYTEALGLFEKIFKRRLVSLGSLQYDTVNAQHNVARCVDSLGEYNRAMNLYRFAYQKWNETMGIHNSGTLVAEHNVGWILNRKGKYADAIKIFEQVLRKQVHALGENHSHTNLTKVNLELVKKKLGITKDSDA